ncbi:MAG: hypothetical protein JW795_17975 [Chitinivibrionales bacterium]|nr:hypothetical protein [Chitinivibrionales bacterium]
MRFLLSIVVSCLPLIPIHFISFSAYAQYPDLIATLSQLPALAETPDKGAFVDVVKAMDEVYPGRIIIGVYPFARSFRNLLDGRADFHIPAMRNPAVDESKLPYKYSSEIIGQLASVLYSNIDKPITQKMVLDAIAQGGKFPYIIDVSPGAEANCAFPATSSPNWESSLRQLQAGRIDAVWNAQEETDLVLKKLQLNKIRRELWGYFEDVIVIQKNTRGDQVDTVISGLLRTLRQSGKLQEIYRMVHKPYDDWQPAQMGW